MTINLKNFLDMKGKMSKMGESQELKQIDGMEISAVTADLYGNGRDDLSLFYFKDQPSSMQMPRQENDDYLGSTFGFGSTHRFVIKNINKKCSSKQMRGHCFQIRCCHDLRSRWS